MTANNQDENNTHHYSLILILHLKFLVRSKKTKKTSVTKIYRRNSLE